SVARGSRWRRTTSFSNFAGSPYGGVRIGRPWTCIHSGTPGGNASADALRAPIEPPKPPAAKTAPDCKTVLRLMLIYCSHSRTARARGYRWRAAMSASAHETRHRGRQADHANACRAAMGVGAAIDREAHAPSRSRRLA